MKHKVLITTSGIGARLGDFTKYTNKSLVRIGTKPAISHIIEAYPTGTPFVVTLGHFGKHIKDFIELAYPDRTFEYVHVNKYKGEGSSLGLSMLAAKDLLQCPFIYHASDTLITEPVPVPDKNWIGAFCGTDTSQYTSWTIREGVLQLHDKGATGTDFIHIGLVGINDFATFWDVLERLYKANPNDQSLNDCQVIRVMIAESLEVGVVEFSEWHDIGNIDALQNAQRAAGSFPDDLDKSGEAIFMFDDFVIKFFADENVVKNRSKRGYILNGFVPDMEGVKGNFYRYKFIPGELYSHIVQPADFKEFLLWVQNKFWIDEQTIDKDIFKNACRTFYYDKTQERIQLFLDANDLRDSEHSINGELIPSLQELLTHVDFNFLSDGLQSRFHGDFILDNILKTEDGYCLIDWRQDFGGLLDVGDRYYDLAKLNHNLCVNHRIISKGLFSVHAEEKRILVDIMRPHTLVKCQSVLAEFLAEEEYDIDKVEMLTALIWLNMAPLHHHPFNFFLYYFGKLHLWRTLQKFNTQIVSDVTV